MIRIILEQDFSNLREGVLGRKALTHLRKLTDIYLCRCGGVKNGATTAMSPLATLRMGCTDSRKTEPRDRKRHGK